MPASIGAYSILHLLLRRGQATGVTSLLYLTPPVAALVEWAVFGVPPTATMWLGMAVACVGVAMVSTSRAAQSKTPIGRGAVVIRPERAGPGRGGPTRSCPPIRGAAADLLLYFAASATPCPWPPLCCSPSSLVRDRGGGALCAAK